MKLAQIKTDGTAYYAASRSNWRDSDWDTRKVIPVDTSTRYIERARYQPNTNQFIPSAKGQYIKVRVVDEPGHSYYRNEDGSYREHDGYVRYAAIRGEWDTLRPHIEAQWRAAADAVKANRAAADDALARAERIAARATDAGLPVMFTVDRSYGRPSVVFHTAEASLVGFLDGLDAKLAEQFSAGWAQGDKDADAAFRERMGYITAEEETARREGPAARVVAAVEAGDVSPMAFAFIPPDEGTRGGSAAELLAKMAAQCDLWEETGHHLAVIAAHVTREIMAGRYDPRTPPDTD